VAGRGGRGGSGAGPPDVEAAALRLLAARALTAQEVRERLLRRGFDPSTIEPLLRRLEARGYLDDRALAYNLASALAARRLYGRPRTAAVLRRRGVPEDAISEALVKVYAELQEEELAREAVRRAGRRPSPGVVSGRKRQALARSLLRRGLSRGAVLGALRGAGVDDELEACASEDDDDEFQGDT
jgi:regulatory protein